MDTADPRVSVVVLTHGRCIELLRTVERLCALPERPRIIVVDNASGDATRQCLRERHPQVTLVALDVNLGAAGRNAGVERVASPFVAFCDDDTWWEPGALRHAADLLQAHPSLGCVSARVIVGADGRPDPTCARMAESPLPRDGLPGTALIGFMAGACVMRTAAFRAGGGYEPRFFLGAEESLLALDMAASGWRIAYVPELLLHHHPSLARDAAARDLLVARNRFWLAWLRLPLPLAWHESRKLLREARQAHRLSRTSLAVLRGMGWVLGARRVVPAPVAAMFACVHGGPPPRGRTRRAQAASGAVR
jgi:GT2 family glycosyltransferase